MEDKHRDEQPQTDFKGGWIFAHIRITIKIQNKEVIAKLLNFKSKQNGYSELTEKMCGAKC